MVLLLKPLTVTSTLFDRVEEAFFTHPDEGDVPVGMDEGAEAATDELVV